jgi:hypothetical protein
MVLKDQMQGYFSCPMSGATSLYAITKLSRVADCVPAVYEGGNMSADGGQESKER